jgi:hypothetical protein
MRTTFLRWQENQARKTLTQQDTYTLTDAVNPYAETKNPKHLPPEGKPDTASS